MKADAGKTYPSQAHDCGETEFDVLAAEEDTGEPGCPVCGLSPEEHPPT